MSRNGCPAGEGAHRILEKPGQTGEGGLKISILARRPLWMPPKDSAKNNCFLKEKMYFLCSSLMKKVHNLSKIYTKVNFVY